MKSLVNIIFNSLLLIFLLNTGSLTAQDKTWYDVDSILGKNGKITGDVYRVTFPRTDLDVNVNGNKIDPALALTSWIAIDAVENDALLISDLVLVEEEVEPVIESVVKNGLLINALHNHLIGEDPRLVYLSIGGSGDPIELAQKIKSVLNETDTPLEPEPLAVATEIADWTDIESGIGYKGEKSGNILQLIIPRQDVISMNGRELPFTLGVATKLNFQRAGEKVISTGVFVVTAGEINPVIKALTENSINITAVNSQLVTENPHLFFMHYWVYDFPENVLQGLNSALAVTNSKH